MLNDMRHLGDTTNSRALEPTSFAALRMDFGRIAAFDPFSYGRLAASRAG